MYRMDDFTLAGMHGGTHCTATSPTSVPLQLQFLSFNVFSIHGQLPVVVKLTLTVVPVEFILTTYSTCRTIV